MVFRNIYVWAWESNSNFLWLSCWQPIRIKLVRAALATHLYRRNITIGSHVTVRSLHLASVADKDTQRAISEGVKKPCHDYLVYAEIFETR